MCREVKQMVCLLSHTYIKPAKMQAFSSVGRKRSAPAEL